MGLSRQPTPVRRLPSLRQGRGRAYRPASRWLRSSVTVSLADRPAQPAGSKPRSLHRRPPDLTAWGRTEQPPQRRVPDGGRAETPPRPASPSARRSLGSSVGHQLWLCSVRSPDRADVPRGPAPACPALPGPGRRPGRPPGHGGAGCRPLPSPPQSVFSQGRSRPLPSTCTPSLWPHRPRRLLIPAGCPSGAASPDAASRPTLPRVGAPEGPCGSEAGVGRSKACAGSPAATLPFAMGSGSLWRLCRVYILYFTVETMSPWDP